MTDSGYFDDTGTVTEVGRGSWTRGHGMRHRQHVCVGGLGDKRDGVVTCNGRRRRTQEYIRLIEGSRAK